MKTPLPPATDVQARGARRVIAADRSHTDRAIAHLPASEPMKKTSRFVPRGLDLHYGHIRNKVKRNRTTRCGSRPRLAYTPAKYDQSTISRKLPDQLECRGALQSPSSVPCGDRRSPRRPFCPSIGPGTSSRAEHPRCRSSSGRAPCFLQDHTLASHGGACLPQPPACCPLPRSGPRARRPASPW